MENNINAIPKLLIKILERYSNNSANKANILDSKLITYPTDDIVKVNWRPMSEKKRETTDDAELYEIINEFTLRVCTPYAFAWLHNLKV